MSRDGGKLKQNFRIFKISELRRRQELLGSWSSRQSKNLEQKQTKGTKSQPEGLEPSLSSLPSVKNFNHWLLVCSLQKISGFNC